jgi:urease accessory protein
MSVNVTGARLESNADAGHARLALRQLCDSLFPLGSFAHSDGLETVVSSGRIASGSDLRGWLETTLTATLIDAEAPAVRDAFHAAHARNFAALSLLDTEMHALRGSASGREASRAMGTRLLTTWQRLRPSDLVQSAIDARTRYTFPVAFGVVCAAVGTTLEETLEAYCYARLAAVVSAAMRLMSIGQQEAHGLLTDVLRGVPASVALVTESVEPPRSFAPLMEIASMSQQYVHSRLFRS